MLTLEDIVKEFEGRHPTTLHYLAQLHDHAHLPPHLQASAADIAVVAASRARNLNDGIELSTGLKHLRDAKDAFVRQAVADKKAATA